MIDKAFSKIDTLFLEYVDFWKKICEIESPSDSKAGVDAVSSCFIRVAEKYGWKIEICPQELCGDVVCITMNHTSNKSPLSLSAHLDTVYPLSGAGGCEIKISGDKIYGPGTCDCKGGAVSALLAMAALEEGGYDRRPVRLLLQTDEEVGSSLSNKETINYICKMAEGSVAFLNLEGFVPNEACLIRKGILNYKFVVKGKEAHSALCAERGASAICEAAHKILELEKLKDPLGITCNCGVIYGGAAANTVAGECTFFANIRFATKEQQEWVCEQIEKIAKNTTVKGCCCEVIKVSERVPMELNSRNSELLFRINQIFEKCGMPTLTMSKRAGGSDAADVSAYGIPCIDSIGVYGGGIHSPSEFARIPSLKEAAKRIIAIACGI